MDVPPFFISITKMVSILSFSRTFLSNIILCNFQRYLDTYASISGYPIHSANWSVVHDEQKDISIINFGIGSPMAGIVMHCLSFLDNLECVLMLGMCGGIGDALDYRMWEFDQEFIDYILTLPNDFINLDWL